LVLAAEKLLVFCSQMNEAKSVSGSTAGVSTGGAELLKLLLT
jgi:hypothetical protein